MMADPRASLRELADEWSRQAENLRLRRGQMTRDQLGHEVLSNCAAALRDVLTLLDAAPAQGWQPTEYFMEENGVMKRIYTAEAIDIPAPPGSPTAEER